MSRVLITGSLGLTGSEAVDFFKEKGWEVIGIDSNMRSKFFGTPEKEGAWDIDIRDEKAINNLFQENDFQAIIHTAAQPSHDWSATNPLLDFDINARGTLVLLEATRNYCPNAVFINVSTDKVYGTNMERTGLEETYSRYNNHFPFDERTGLDFSMKSPFGCSKASADLYAQEYGRYFGLQTVTFRPGCITGRRHEGAEQHGFLAYLAKCIKEDIPYKIYGFGGKQVRDLIHSYDLVNAFWHVIQNPKIGEVYNIGGGPERSVSVLEAISLLENETGNKATTEYVDKVRLGDRQWDVHDVSKFREDYPDWDYRYSLSDIIKDVCTK